MWKRGIAAGFAAGAVFACAIPLKNVALAPGPRIAQGEAFGDEFECAEYATRDGAVVFRDAALISAHEHAPPIDIEYEVMTDSTNVRLAYGAHQIIFDWEIAPNELRIDGPPAGTHVIHGFGYIAPNHFALVRQVVTNDSMTLSVDGVLRARIAANYTGYHAPICVFGGAGATLAVRAVRIRAPGE